MAIMKHIVSFDIPQKEVECCQCKGKGTIKTTKYNNSTILFSLMVGCTWVFSAMGIAGKEPNYYIGLPLFLISTIAAITLFVEYKQQKLGEVKKKN